MIDNFDSNTILEAFLRLIPSLHESRVATSVFKTGSFRLLEGPSKELSELDQEML